MEVLIPVFSSFFDFFFSLRWDTMWNQASPVQCYSTSSISNAVSMSLLVDYIHSTIVIIYYKASFLCAQLFKQLHSLDLSTQAKEGFPLPSLHYLVFHSLHLHAFWWITNQQLWGLMACLGMVSIFGYSRCFWTSAFPPFLLFTNHSLWTKYSKGIERKVFQNHMANSILHSSRSCLFIQK